MKCVKGPRQKAILEYCESKTDFISALELYKFLAREIIEESYRKEGQLNLTEQALLEREKYISDYERPEDFPKIFECSIQMVLKRLRDKELLERRRVKGRYAFWRITEKGLEVSRQNVGFQGLFLDNPNFLVAPERRGFSNYVIHETISSLCLYIGELYAKKELSKEEIASFSYVNILKSKKWISSLQDEFGKSKNVEKLCKKALQKVSHSETWENGLELFTSGPMYVKGYKNIMMGLTYFKPNAILDLLSINPFVSWSISHERFPELEEKLARSKTIEDVIGVTVDLLNQSYKLTGEERKDFERGHRKILKLIENGDLISDVIEGKI